MFVEKVESSGTVSGARLVHNKRGYGEEAESGVACFALVSVDDNTLLCCDKTSVLVVL